MTDGDRFWRDVETYLDEVGEPEEDEEPPSVPPYLWLATPQRVIPDLDVADVMGHYVDDRGWEEMSVEFDLEGVPAFQAALDAFVEANKGVVSYTQDTSRCVLLDGYLRAKGADEVKA